MNVPVTNHIAQALGKLISRFQKKPRFSAWIACNVNQTQLLEDATWTVINSRDVDTCDETRLILLGKIVGQGQRGTLEQFRLYVKARVLVNRSRGSAPEILKIARLLLGSVAFWEGPPAYVRIEALEPLGIRDPNATAELLRDAKVSGVRLDLVYNVSGQSDALIGSYVAGEVDAGRGGSFDGTTGGMGAAMA